jgi:hypothetical protein
MNPEEDARREKLRAIASCKIRRGELLKDYEAHGFFTVDEFVEWLDIAPPAPHKTHSHEIYKYESRMHLPPEDIYDNKEFETFVRRDNE